MAHETGVIVHQSEEMRMLIYAVKRSYLSLHGDDGPYVNVSDSIRTAYDRMVTAHFRAKQLDDWMEDALREIQPG